MPNFYVPEKFHPGLQLIANLSDAETEQLHKALESATPTLRPGDMVSHVRASLPSAIAELDDLIRTLRSLNHARVRAELSVKQFVPDIVAPASLTAVKQFDRASLDQKLITLLSTPSLSLAAKAIDVQHEYERVFISARILTDMRPVFNQAGTEIEGTMLVHNLTIKCSERNQIRNVFFALDDADIGQLRKLLDRADTKTATLEALIKSTGIQYLESK